ncbi:MAG TPA: DinB family protein [Patescibacteria group bacterium]|nr:DinB family protein [Patescibacteria group bacterium]
MTDRELLIAGLAAVPGLLRELTRDVLGPDAAKPPAVGEWSVIDVVRHLVEGDREKFLPRLRRMLAEDRPVFSKTALDPGDASDLPTLVAAFGSAREQVARTLAGMDATAWSRTGVTPSRGELSVEAYARSTTKHDTEHLRQLQQIRTALGLRPKRCEARLALTIAELTEALAPAADHLAAAVVGLDEPQRRRRPAPGEWCVNEVMAHLLHVETELFLPRLRRMATEDGPTFVAFTPEAWTRERDHGMDSFAGSLEAFARARAETLVFLRALPAAAGERLGVSSFFGPISLRQYATHIADHDIEHLRQIQACARAAATRG